MLYSRNEHNTVNQLYFQKTKKIIPRDILYSMVPVVNNTLFYTGKFAKRVNLMFKCSYHKIIIVKEVGRNFGGVGYAYGKGCDDSFTGVYLSPNSSSCICWYLMYSFLYVNHTLIKWFKKKKVSNP